jgi:hypothetical protein
MTTEEIRSDKETVTFEFHGPGDKHGRYFFTMHWWQENFHMGPQWRGQCFTADPREYVNRARVLNKVRLISYAGEVQILEPHPPTQEGE